MVVVKCLPLSMLEEKETLGAGWKKFESWVYATAADRMARTKQHSKTGRYWPLLPLSTSGVSFRVLQKVWLHSYLGNNLFFIKDHFSGIESVIPNIS